MDPGRNPSQGEVTRPRWAAAVALAVVFAASFVWFVRQRGVVEAGVGKGYPSSLPAGGEIFAIDVSTVTEIDYEQSTRKIIARRPGGSNDRFSIEVINGPDTVERCEGGAAFASILNQLFSIRARRELGREEVRSLQSSHARDFATLRIRDDTAIGPQEYRVLFVDDRDRTVVLVDGDSTYESTLPRSVFERLSAGCSALAGKSG